MKKIAFILAITLTVLFSSCKKDRFDYVESKPENMGELTVPSSFDWKTTKDVQLTLTAPGNGIVEVNNSQGATFQRAFLMPNQPYEMKLTVPSYEKTVKLKFMGQEVSLELGTANINYQFN
jgi:ABC-type oligopeptide transport system substrate-binding subunit